MHTVSPNTAILASQFRDKTVQTPILGYTGAFHTSRTTLPAMSFVNHVTSPLPANHLIEIQGPEFFFPNNMGPALWDVSVSINIWDEAKTYGNLAFLLFLQLWLGWNFYGFCHGGLNLFVIPVSMRIQGKLEVFFRCPRFAGSPSSPSFLRRPRCIDREACSLTEESLACMNYLKIVRQVDAIMVGGCSWAFRWSTGHT